MEKKLIYFGCIGTIGHHLYGKDVTGSHRVNIPNLNPEVIKFIDGTFTPANRTEGIYNESIVPPVRIVAWWDYSVDNRQGSNSVLIGYGYDSAEEMIDAAYQIFPGVMKRQPRPVPLNIETFQHQENDKEVIKKFHEMCLQSLCPDTYERYENVCRELYKNRKQLKETPFPF